MSEVKAKTNNVEIEKNVFGHNSIDNQLQEENIEQGCAFSFPPSASVCARKC
jgi:hypothetical protein